MQRIDVERVGVGTFTCSPRTAPSCGAAVPMTAVTCPECKTRQTRPIAPVPAGQPISNAILYHDGKPLVLVAEVSAGAAGYVAQMARKWAIINTKGRPRLSGIGDRQKMVGTLAPQPLRQRYGCRRSMVSRGTEPEDWLAVAQECHAVFAEHLGEQAAANAQTADAVAPIWKWEGTGWTSGVLNLTQVLPYHRDSGNLAGSWSAMIGARSSGVTGGHLYLPEFDAVLGVGHRSLICFPGAEVTHGVTPMTVAREGWRVTAVFYGLKGCASCLPDEAAELERASKRSTDRARIIATGQGPKATPGRVQKPETRAPMVAKTEQEYLDDLVEFARQMVAANDLEPWAGMLAELYGHGDVDREAALWLVKVYNAYDALGSAWGVYRRWPTPEHWHAADDRADAAGFPCTQERRNLRGGKVIQHLQSFTNQISGYGHEPWLKVGLRTGRPGADFLTLADHVRRIWGVGRQTAFEWAEFLGKVVEFPVLAPNAMLWESEGPRRALQRLYGNPKPTPAWLDARSKECRGYLADHGVLMDWWDFETVICDFNVGRDGRYYVGRHLAALREEINELDGDDRRMLDGAWERYVPATWQDIAPGIDKTKLPLYRDRGEIRSAP